MVAYTVALMACGTINFGATMQGTIEMFIDNSGFPGGPLAYGGAFYNRISNTVGNSAYVVASFIADGVMVSVDIELCSESNLSIGISYFEFELCGATAGLHLSFQL